MITRRIFLSLSAGLPLAGMTATLAGAATPQIYSEDGVAIDGTDPVAYFAEGRPISGSPDFTHDWNGSTWRFTSTDNRDAFAASPDAYAPQFGGYCAWAVAEGYIAPTVPEAWTLHDGKLYLNFSRRIRRRWEQDIPANITRGLANWPSVLA